MDIHVTNKTNNSWEVVYVIKVRQLFSRHRVSKIVPSVGGGRYKQNKCNVLCCKVINACSISNDV